MQVYVNRSIDLTTFPITKDNIPFSIFSHSEQSEACGGNADGYVIDSYKDWRFIKYKINSDKNHT